VLDLFLVAAFVVYGIGSGIRARRTASRDIEEYFLAGRRLPGWQSGLSMTATQYAADTPLLAAGLVATGGIFALWRLWIYGIAFLLLGFLLGAAWWRSRVVTDAEFCELRYHGRPLVVAVGVPLSADLDSPGVWRRSASNLISIFAIYCFTTLYSATGGLRSVVTTDLGQLLLLFVATGIYAWIAADAAGGLGNLSEALADVVGESRARELLAFDPGTAAEVGGALLAVLGLQWLVQMNSDGTGYLAQRCMACRSAPAARRAPVIFAFAQILLRSLLWLPIFVSLLIIFPLEPGQSAAERELTFVRGIETLLPPGARGLILVGMLAALASTIDTHLNWGASYLSNDLYSRLLCRSWLGRTPGRRELVWVARASSPILVVISLAVMARLDSIQAAWHVTLLLGAGLGVPLLLRWLWWRANAWGELASIVGSALAAPVLLATLDTEAWRLLAIAAIGTAASVGASLATAPEPEEHLRAFYERVRPPGFWRHGAARRRLWSSGGATLAAAGTLFASLVGFGSWLVGSTPPGGLTPAVWIGLNLCVAALLIPIWWRQLGRGDESESSDGG